MRTLLSVSLALNVLLAVYCFSGGDTLPVVDAGGGDGVATENGDANGDGVVDVADAVHLLFFLFEGGPPPAPIECPACPPSAVPATGQTKCFDDVGAEILCSAPEFRGQDGFYRAGCDDSGRFVDNEDGTVTDLCTGLMWTQATQDVNGDLDFTLDDLISWEDSLSFCEARDLGGETDWRLPNVNELRSLTRYTENDPSVDASFTLVPPHQYWSSTSDVESPSDAWFVSFDRGGSTLDTANKRFGRFHVLCVRDAD